jgi:ubiquinol-cytochrome c reductase cytochrome c1 subunit
MKKLILLFLLQAPVLSFAAGGSHVTLMDADVDLSDQRSLQHGAKLFVNYCLSCHAASYMRYSRAAEDLGIPVDIAKKNLLLATKNIGDTMNIAMDPEDAKTWLGVAPPDLSVITRSRGSDWLYTFLNSFYLDDSKPTGVNNLVFKDTAMPAVLWELQGWQEAIVEEHTDEEGHTSKHIAGLEVVSPGSMDEETYQAATRDLVNFLTYVGEPALLVRKKVGFWVIVFLLILLVPAYKLKKEYWKDVR